jgi:hypothetical protein
MDYKRFTSKSQAPSSRGNGDNRALFIDQQRSGGRCGNVNPQKKNRHG